MIGVGSRFRLILPRVPNTPIEDEPIALELPYLANEEVPVDAGTNESAESRVVAEAPQAFRRPDTLSETGEQGAQDSDDIAGDDAVGKEA